MSASLVNPEPEVDEEYTAKPLKPRSCGAVHARVMTELSGTATSRSGMSGSAMVKWRGSGTEVFPARSAHLLPARPTTAAQETTP